MTVPSRVIAILQLYLGDQRVWTAEAMARAIDVSTSTAYRYVKELCAAGFLDPVVGSGYVLGPAIIEYDHLLRVSDPLIAIAAPRMRALIDAVDPRIDVILCRRFRDRVLCIHQENGSAPHPRTSYARGVAMPLFLGATSKVILAHLPERGLKRLYLENEAEIRAGIPDVSWKAFRDQLRAIRADGICLTRAEVAPDRVGLAAPVFRGGQIIASLSMVMESATFAAVSARLDVSGRMREVAAAVNAEAAEAAPDVARA